MSRFKRPSLETILTTAKETRSQADWSMVWSTEEAGSSRHSRAHSRRKYRRRALAAAAALAAHCRAPAHALNDGFFTFLLFLVLATAVLANPMRHFELYLGQWSLSGPGRAFRYIPMLDGIGIAICINALVRAITSATSAAIAGVYLTGTLADADLPFTYCRNESLQRIEALSSQIDLFTMFKQMQDAQISGTEYLDENDLKGTSLDIKTCNLNTSGLHPLYNTPAFNYFYVEVMRFRDKPYFSEFNPTLAYIIIAVWLLIYAFMLRERFHHGRLIWNNLYRGLVFVPVVSGLVVLTFGFIHFASVSAHLMKFARAGNRQFFKSMVDAFETALYVHASGLGTELVFGKGLNYYANGHIDPLLNAENVCYSAVATLLVVLHATGAAVCALLDAAPAVHVHESTLWIMPLYSKCMLAGGYAHLAYWERTVMALAVLLCLLLSLIFCTNGGLLLLECVDGAAAGLVTPLLCVLQLTALLYAYRSRDFLSDMNVATEENACSTRIDTQWKIIPAVLVLFLVCKIVTVCYSQLPGSMWACALLPLLAMLIAIPVKGVVMAYKYKVVG
ncbi:uncharacterized protein LOC105387774 isoform X2 [Plutella xylostella]|uniref:uncharacterized protein LOC105387774 isoform X2 n=1 Tax=Plutella xylostella TaxID=51655 RepID=UPI002032EEAB|nr:uncharacterized protein LOC105387774 isoform X2 [Plutella xylostella]